MERTDTSAAWLRHKNSDLARRLARYRRRVAAEGRPRSVSLIDRAIRDADEDKSGSE